MWHIDYIVQSLYKECQILTKEVRLLKKKIWGIIATILVFAFVLFVVFDVLKCEISVIESPDGDYEIVSWLIDKGGFGYSGAFYIKEKGLFSKWYKLGTGTFSGKWLSETEFSIYHSYMVDNDYYKEYNVNDFLGK